MQRRSHLPVQILVPYVAAAARDVADGEPLDDRALAAIADAQSQLASEATTTAGCHGAVASTVVEPPGGIALEFATLVLGAGRSEQERPALETATPSRLTEVATALGRMAEGDQAAAEMVAAVFDSATFLLTAERAADVT